MSKLLTMNFVSWNSLGTLKWCVKSLLENTANWDLVKVNIIDNGSTDGSWEFLDQRYIRDKINVIQLDQNYGPYYALNRGMEQAEGDYIGNYWSEDMVMCRHWDDELLPFLSPDRWIVARYIMPCPEPLHSDDRGFPVYAPELGAHPDNFQYERFLDLADDNKIVEIRPRPFGNSSIVPKSVLDNFGPYPEDDFWNGDFKPNKPHVEDRIKGQIMSDGLSTVCLLSFLSFHFWAQRPEYRGRVKRDLHRVARIVPEGYTSVEDWYIRSYLND